MLITNDSIQINVEGSLLSNEKTVKLLGIIVGIIIHSKTPLHIKVV